MYISYSRNYADIIGELAEAILRIDNLFEFIEMDRKSWDELGSEMQFECAKTMADDIFYTLGDSHEVGLGNGLARYDVNNGIIKVFNKDGCIHIVKLK